MHPQSSRRIWTATFVVVMLAASGVVAEGIYLVWPGTGLLGLPLWALSVVIGWAAIISISLFDPLKKLHRRPGVGDGTGSSRPTTR